LQMLPNPYLLQITPSVSVARLPQNEQNDIVRVSSVVFNNCESCQPCKH
jgi:hypothetical protein